MDESVGRSAWPNAVSVVLCGPFVQDVAKAVGNDGAADSGARYLLTLGVGALRDAGLAENPLHAFDLFCYDLEALDKLWPAVHCAAVSAPTCDLPRLARFIAERLPALWRRKGAWEAPEPVTAAVSIADRIDTLVAMFSVGLAPTGSKDPYALRRAANQLLQCVCFPIGQEAS